VALALEALAINVGDLQVECLVEPQCQARDGGEGDLVVPGCGSLEERPAFFPPENRRETVGGLRAHERQGGPSALEDGLREKSAATGAEAHGSRGEAIAVFAVQEGGWKRLFGEPM
jgi:hypothetical protein